MTKKETFTCDVCGEEIGKWHISTITIEKDGYEHASPCKVTEVHHVHNNDNNDCLMKILKQFKYRR